MGTATGVRWQLYPLKEVLTDKRTGLRKSRPSSRSHSQETAEPERSPRFSLQSSTPTPNLTPALCLSLPSRIPRGHPARHPVPGRRASLVHLDLRLSWALGTFAFKGSFFREKIIVIIYAYNSTGLKAN